jgi:hypothetical protein
MYSLRNIYLSSPKPRWRHKFYVLHVWSLLHKIENRNTLEPDADEQPKVDRH